MIQVNLIMQRYEGEPVFEQRVFLDQDGLDKHIDEVLSSPYMGMHIKSVTSSGPDLDPQYRAKDDIHKARACLLFNKAPEDISQFERQLAKKAFYVCMAELAEVPQAAVNVLLEEINKRSGVVSTKDFGKAEEYKPCSQPQAHPERCDCSWTAFGSCPVCRR